MRLSRQQKKESTRENYDGYTGDLWYTICAGTRSSAASSMGTAPPAFLPGQEGRRGPDCPGAVAAWAAGSGDGEVGCLGVQRYVAVLGGLEP